MGRRFHLPPLLVESLERKSYNNSLLIIFCDFKKEPLFRNLWDTDCLPSTAPPPQLRQSTTTPATPMLEKLKSSARPPRAFRYLREAQIQIHKYTILEKLKTLGLLGGQCSTFGGIPIPLRSSPAALSISDENLRFVFTEQILSYCVFQSKLILVLREKACSKGKTDRRDPHLVSLCC